MVNFQKIIVQMLKVQMDYQQRSDAKQQRMEEHLMEQQVQPQKELQQQQQQRNEERLLQALMKSEERQNQMEELLLKSLNGTKTSENETFSQGTIYSTIETFESVPENNKTFYAFYRRFEDVDCKEWSNKKKVRLLLRKLCTTKHIRFVDFILPRKKTTMNLEFSETVKLLSELFGPNTSLFHKRWKCFNIFKDDQQDYLTFAAVTVNKHCNNFKLADLTADDFKCLIFAQGLVSAENAEIRRRVLTKLENELGLAL